MDDLIFQDDLFDNPKEDWEQSFSDTHFRQRHLLKEGAIYCETLMTVHKGDQAAAVALIRGPWDWWQHGCITGFTATAEGASDQILSPVWWFITRVGLHIFPPIELPDMRGTRVPLMLTKHFTGPTTMDVYPSRSDDAIIIRGRFHGVQYHGLGIPNRLAEWLHLDAESGTMPAPFPKGTGWVGLLHRLEEREPRHRSHQRAALTRE